MKELPPKVIEFIEKNAILIEQKRWEEIYKNPTDIPDDFTEAMLAAGINPLL